MRAGAQLAFAIVRPAQQDSFVAIVIRTEPTLGLARGPCRAGLFFDLVHSEYRPPTRRRACRSTPPLSLILASLPLRPFLLQHQFPCAPWIARLGDHPSRRILPPQPTWRSHRDEPWS